MNKTRNRTFLKVGYGIYRLRQLGLIAERSTHHRVIFEDLQPDGQLHESDKLHDEEDQPASDIDEEEDTISGEDIRNAHRQIRERDYTSSTHQKICCKK